MTEAELAALEESGKIGKRPEFAGLAALLGLHPAKLERIANGWVPSGKRPGRLARVAPVSDGTGRHRGQLLSGLGRGFTREAVAFDTGWNAEPVIAAIEENQLQLRHIFLTHTHEDHIAGLAALRGKFPKAHLHSGSKHAPPQQRNRANDFIHLGSLRITNRETPGHAEDGVTYIVGTWPEDAPHTALAGDAIFAGSIGTGFQSWDLARQKIREQIFSLPPDTLICPGHGPLTTVAEEKANNPFFS